MDISETNACGFLMLQAVLLLMSTTQEEISTIFKTLARVEFVFKINLDRISFDSFFVMAR